MKKEQIVKALELKYGTAKKCEECKGDKAAKEPVKTHQNLRTSCILEPVPMDLCGPMLEPFDGSK